MAGTGWPAIVGPVHSNWNAGFASRLEPNAKVDPKYSTTNIAKRKTMKQSSMPEGLAAGMSADEFLDLVQFLSSLKEGGKK